MHTFIGAKEYNEYNQAGNTTFVHCVFQDFTYRITPSDCLTHTLLYCETNGTATIQHGTMTRWVKHSLFCPRLVCMIYDAHLLGHSILSVGNTPLRIHILSNATRSHLSSTMGFVLLNLAMVYHIYQRTVLAGMEINSIHSVYFMDNIQNSINCFI